MSESRIDRLEMQVSYHEKEIDELKKGHGELSEALSKMVGSLNQIKWAVIGAILYAIVQEFGWLAALKAVLV
ncbi:MULTISPECIES: hypothetical protein [Neptunomonas]|uniref:Uncharacterized protein n=1 Tax=Neptunomonas marina TaxID=1815562 RepID=A0A437QDS2_9GAMM|nr:MULTISPECIES: hypothetical protein [Neptunomonas]RVU32700.1 hypothetical protein EOE65_03330 [Neptunomonas marina]